MGVMQSPETTRASFSVPQDVLDEFDELVEAEGYDSRSAMLCEMVEDKVDDGADDVDEYIPVDDLHAAVYRAAVKYAKKPGFLLRFDFFQAQMAQDAGVSTQTVEHVLYHLQGAGYVRRQACNPGDELQMETWRVKPRCADPRQWKHRRGT